MLIEFQCKCGHEFRTRTENAGRSIICPNCLAPSVVPDPESTRIELPIHEELRQLAPPVPLPPIERTHAPTDINQAVQSGLIPTPQHADSSAQNRRPRSDAPPTPHPNRAKSTSSRSNGRSDRRDRNDFHDRNPADEVELIDEWTSPRRKKRKAGDDSDLDTKSGNRKSKKPRRPSGTNVPLIIGGTVAALLVVVTMGVFAVPALVTALKSGGKIKTPQEFEKFEETEFPFRCEIPKGWEVESRGGSGNVPPSVRIEKGSVKIVYRSSQSGAAIQDMSQAQANMAGGELADELKPVARVHDYQRDKFSNDMPNYKEIGPVEQIDTGWGEGRLSAFTASSGFSGTIYGYRVTLLTSQFQWNVVCQCSTKRDFIAYQPIFRRIIASTGR